MGGKGNIAGGIGAAVIGAGAAFTANRVATAKQLRASNDGKLDAAAKRKVRWVTAGAAITGIVAGYIGTSLIAEGIKHGKEGWERVFTVKGFKETLLGGLESGATTAASSATTTEAPRSALGTLGKDGPPILAGGAGSATAVPRFEAAADDGRTVHTFVTKHKADGTTVIRNKTTGQAIKFKLPDPG